VDLIAHRGSRRFALVIAGVVGTGPTSRRPWNLSVRGCATCSLAVAIGLVTLALIAANDTHTFLTRHCRNVSLTWN